MVKHVDAETVGDGYDYGTRYGNLLRYDKYNNSYFERSPLYAGKHFFNKLPTNIRTIQDVFLNKN